MTRKARLNFNDVFPWPIRNRYPLLRRVPFAPRSISRSCFETMFAGCASLSAGNIIDSRACKFDLTFDGLLKGPLARRARRGGVGTKRRKTFIKSVLADYRKVAVRRGGERTDNYWTEHRVRGSETPRVERTYVIASRERRPGNALAFRLAEKVPGLDGR